MKNLILDHFRRWWWVLALCGGLEFALGWCIANKPDVPYEFYGLMIAMWSGAILLQMDWQHGAVRAVAILPLTGRQIGRAWWLATATIPAITLAVLVLLGGGTNLLLHPNRVFPLGRLALIGMFNLPWLAMMFMSVFARIYVYEKDWMRIYNAFLSLLSVATMFGGMLLCQNASKSPVKCALFLGVGAWLLLAGWFRAERFDFGRGGPLFPRFVNRALRRRASLGLTPLAPKPQPVPVGYGAIPFLIFTNFVRGFLIMAFMVAMMWLIFAWQHQKPESFGIMFIIMPSWFLVFFHLPPSLRQVRFLRTLPMSSTRLAALLMSVVVLPLVALGVVLAGIAGVVYGAPLAVLALKGYLLILAPAGLCVFLSLGRSEGKLTFHFYLLIMTVFFAVPVYLLYSFQYRQIPVALVGLVALVFVLLAFWLTQFALKYTSRAYRIQMPAGGALPWTGGT